MSVTPAGTTPHPTPPPNGKHEGPLAPFNYARLMEGTVYGAAY